MTSVEEYTFLKLLLLFSFGNATIPFIFQNDEAQDMQNSNF
jgi:hypothetical protein